MTTFGFQGVTLQALSPEASADRVLRAARGRESVAFHLCNAYTLASTQSDAHLREKLRDERSFNLPDGTPLAWLMRRAGCPISGPVRGPELLLDCLDKGRDSGAKHMFFGSDLQTLQSLKERCESIFPGLEIVQMTAPAHGPVSSALVDEALFAYRASGANVLWVALGTPKQDIFVHAVSQHAGVVAVAVGAAVDFAAGRVPEAPRWLQGSGFEWAYRLLREPGRLWRRYTIGNARFVWAALSNEWTRRT